MKKKLLFIVAIAISTTMCSQNSIVESNNSFTFDVMRNINKDDISKDGTNMFVSPFSIYDALAMAYDGAAKKTAKEMRSVMKFKKDQTESHDEFVKLLNEYKKDNSVFTITNAAVAQKNYNFLDSYMKCLKDFDATISQADFSKPEERADAVKKINDWVSKNTNKKITDLLSNNDIDELTRLISMQTGQPSSRAKRQDR